MSIHSPFLDMLYYRQKKANNKRGAKMSPDELLQEKREDILRVAAKRGAFNVRVFGSVARGEADERQCYYEGSS